MCAAVAVPLRWPYVSFHVSVAVLPCSTYFPEKEPAALGAFTTCFGISCAALSVAETLYVGVEPAVPSPATTSAHAASPTVTLPILPSISPPASKGALCARPQLFRAPSAFGLRGRDDGDKDSDGRDGSQDLRRHARDRRRRRLRPRALEAAPRRRPAVRRLHHRGGDQAEHRRARAPPRARSEEHTSELQSHSFLSY